MIHTIDINCDLGESYGCFTIGNDDVIVPMITSCSIACGFHGGDPVHMEKALRRAMEYGVQIGAHPSFPDLWGFGRRAIHLDKAELRSIVRYQVAAICGMARALGGRITFVKPHGALYHITAHDREQAEAVVEAVLSLQENLAFLGLPGSMMEEVAHEHDIPFIAEGFADRRYRDGTLIARGDAHAIIDDPQEAAQQVLSIICEQKVRSPEGNEIPVKASSICVHGDHPNADKILEAIDRTLDEHGITKRPFVL